MADAAPIFDPSVAGYRDNPYPLLARLRVENPVHWSPPLKSWVVTRHADVQHVLRADTMSVDKITPFYKALPSIRQAELETLVRYLGRWMTFRDPPDHGRLRMLVARAFTPKAMLGIQPHVETVTQHLIDDLHGREICDLIADFTTLLPAYVILDMLGVPRGSLPDMKRWSDEIALFIGTSQVTPDRNRRAQDGVIGMANAFRQLIAEHRADPRPDMLMTLIEANEAGAGKLDDDELIATAILFLFAGHETSANLMAMASLALMRNEDWRAAFLKLEAPQTITTAVEEFLRYDGPTPAMMRIATVEHELGGQTIKANDRIVTLIGAANRDPDVFKAPDDLDFARRPNPHVTFGYGPHFCLGAPLARMEAQIALPALHQRYPIMRLATETLDWVDGLILRGPKALPVRLNS